LGSIEFVEPPYVPPYHDPNAPAKFSTWTGFVSQYTESPAAIWTSNGYTVSGSVITPSDVRYFVFDAAAIVAFDADRRFSQLSMYADSYDLPGLGFGDRFMSLAAIGEPGFDFALRSTFFSGTSPFLALSPTNGDAIALAANPFALGWDYQSFGVWDSPSRFGPQITAATFGAPTPASAVPTSGTATFTGKLGGLYVSSSGEGSVATGNVTMNADFGARSLAFTSTGTVTTRDLATTVPATNLDLSGTLTYVPGSSTFSGVLNNAGGTLSGQSTGRFYGPGAQELGGVFSVRSPTTSELFAGAYGARR
jgi:hypothetical protein